MGSQRDFKDMSVWWEEGFLWASGGPKLAPAAWMLLCPRRL